MVEAKFLLVNYNLGNKASSLQETRTKKIICFKENYYIAGIICLQSKGSQLFNWLSALGVLLLLSMSLIIVELVKSKIMMSVKSIVREAALV